MRKTLLAAFPFLAAFMGPSDAAACPPWWRSKSSLVLCGVLLIVGVALLTGHTAHVLDALPYLILAACPLMHLFMHHAHGGSDDHAH